MIISDSNLIIYAASKKYPALVDWFEKNKPAASAISLVEVLGYHKLQGEDKRALEDFFAELTIHSTRPRRFFKLRLNCARNAPCLWATR